MPCWSSRAVWSKLTETRKGTGMQAKSGKLVKGVKPVKPEEVFEADVADPGKVEQAKAKQVQEGKGKYGKEQVPAHKSSKDEEDDEKVSWIELEMVDEQDEPVSGVKYQVKLPDGSEATGTLDNEGFARIDGIEPGQCEVTFPELDKDAWEKA